MIQAKFYVPEPNRGVTPTASRVDVSSVPEMLRPESQDEEKILNLYKEKKEEVVTSKTSQIQKKPITSISAKPNLLKLLSSYKNGSNNGEVFKTIGNRIVIPMKVALPGKKSDNINSHAATQNRTTTFQMSVSRVRPTATFTTASSPTRGKLVPLNGLGLRREVRTVVKPMISVIPKLNIKTEARSNFSRFPSTEVSRYSSTESVSGDLNKFMSSVSKNFGIVPRHDDLDSVGSSDSYNMASSSTSSKVSDFDDSLEDNDLTNLGWLSSNNKDLLKTIRKCNPDDPGIGMSGDETDEENQDNKFIFTATSRINGQNTAPTPVPNDFKYNPLSKPPYSFSCLIFMAIEDSYLKRLPVKDIYAWVCKHFPYFRTAPSGWKNSIRHNLSLNRCFKKADCRKDSAKGSRWCIDPAYRPNLVQALKRSPFYPYLHPTGIGQPLSLSNLANLLPGAHTGRVPTWTPALPPAALWADPDMASAALNLMGLKGNENGSVNNTESISNTLQEIFRDAEWINDPENRFRERKESEESVGREELVVTGADQDHNYSVVPPKKKARREENRCQTPDSEKSAPDAAYEFETGGVSDEDVAEDCSDKESDDGDKTLFDSGFGSMKDFRLKKDIPKSPKKKAVTAKKYDKKRKITNKSEKQQAKRRRHSDVKSAPKSEKKKRVSSIKVRIKNAKIKTKQPEDKCSDVDSGKDSPKANRLSRSKRLKQRLYRRNNVSNYHTRSSGYRLVGPDVSAQKKMMKKRKRNTSVRSECTDDEEEIKRAAGSLLRLAGLIKSPLSSSIGTFD